MSRKIHELIEDVIVVAMHNLSATTAFLERQVAECVVAAIIRRTQYKHATAKANVYQDTGTITVKVELFDYVDGPKVAIVEHSHSRVKQQEPIPSRKL